MKIFPQVEAWEKKDVPAAETAGMNCPLGKEPGEWGKRGTVLGDKLVTDYKLWKGDLAEDLEPATSAFPSPKTLMPAMLTEPFN